MKKILCVIVLLLLLSSCGESNRSIDTDVESEQDSVTETDVPADVTESSTSVGPASDPSSVIIPEEGSITGSDSDNLNFTEEKEITEGEFILDATLEGELNDLYEAAVYWGYTKNWETVFSETYGLMFCTDALGLEIFRGTGEYNKHWFFSENDIIANRKCIAWLYFGRKFGEVSPGQILENLLAISPSVVTFHEESIFDCYEKGYYEFTYKGDVYCFMKKDYHFVYMEEGEMIECTDVLIRMEGEEIPHKQLEGTSIELSFDGKYFSYGDNRYADDILQFVNEQLLNDCLKLWNQNIDDMAEDGIITQIRSDGSLTYCQFKGLDIELNGGEDGMFVDAIYVPMSEIFTGDATLNFFEIKKILGGGFSFGWNDVFVSHGPYLYHFETTEGINLYMGANLDTTFNMDGWCVISYYDELTRYYMDVMYD